MPPSRSIGLVALAALFAIGCANASSGTGGGDTADLAAQACSCTRDTDCQAKQVCDGCACVECLRDAACPAGTICSARHACVQGCNAMHGCANGARCDLDAGVCLECAADTDCRDPNRPRCDPQRQLCVPCLPAGLGNGAMGNPPADNCATNSYCAAQANGVYGCTPGCKDDSDCKGDGGAGLRCDLKSHDCVACLGDMDCPLGKICTASACVDGCNDMHGCPNNLACCNGACADTTNDAANCGACGKGCQGGFQCCAGACTNPTTDSGNCGACGNSCTNLVAHGMGACVMRTCTIGSCDPGWADCVGGIADGCETHTDVNVNNCGACNNACQLPHALPKCVGGKCAVDTCIAPFADCDGNAANGCETDTNSDSRNCGGCGVVCPQGFACNNGHCFCGGLGACAPGMTRTVACGNCGTEVDTCTNNCQWAAGTCMNQGVCAAGSTRTVACDNCGTETDSCSNTCQWTLGTCGAQGVCAPGATRTVGCGNCGTRTDTCSNGCQWGTGTCNGQGACTPGSTQQGSCDQCAYQVCTNSCSWGACQLKPGNACTYNSGTHTRGCACTWFACGASQLQWCLSTCQWSSQCSCCNAQGCTRCE